MALIDAKLYKAKRGLYNPLIPIHYILSMKWENSYGKKLMKYCYIPNIKADEYILGSIHDISGESDVDVEYCDERSLEEIKQYIRNNLYENAKSIEDSVHKSEVFRVLSHYEYDENDKPYISLALWTKDGLVKLRADEACPEEFATVLNNAIHWNDKYQRCRESDIFSRDKKV